MAKLGLEVVTMAKRRTEDHCMAYDAYLCLTCKQLFENLCGGSYSAT